MIFLQRHILVVRDNCTVKKEIKVVLSKNAVKLWKIIIVVVAVLTNVIKVFCLVLVD